MSLTIQTNFEPAVTGPKRFFLKRWQTIGIPLYAIAGGGILSSIMMTTILHPLAMIMALSSLAATLTAIILTVIGTKTEAQESARMKEISKQVFIQLPSNERQADMCKDVWLRKKGSIWNDPGENPRVHQLRYNKKTKLLELRQRNCETQDLDFLENGILWDDYCDMVNDYLNESKTVTAPPLKSTQNATPHKALLASKLLVQESTEWDNSVQAKVPQKLHPSIKELKALVDAANHTSNSEEASHTLTRIITDTLEASKRYENVVITAAHLPSKEKYHAEALTALETTISNLKEEAQTVVNAKADLALEGLQAHTSYVKSRT